MHNDVGKTIYARDKVSVGIITNMVSRFCAGCGQVRPVYSVKWKDGHRTYPCPAGCKENPDGTIEIE